MSMLYIKEEVNVLVTLSCSCYCWWHLCGCSCYCNNAIITQERVCCWDQIAAKR